MRHFDFPDGFFETLQAEGGYIAGSSLLHFLLNDGSTPGDLDLFVAAEPNKSGEYFMRHSRLYEACCKLMPMGPTTDKEYKFFQLYSGSTYTADGDEIRYQIAVITHSPVINRILKFDFPCLHMWFDGQTLTAMPYVAGQLRSRVIDLVTPPHIPIRLPLARLKKYRHKGFHFSLPLLKHAVGNGIELKTENMWYVEQIPTADKKSDVGCSTICGSDIV